MSRRYSAYRGRTVLTLSLELQSPMHVGSGFDEPQSADEKGETATVVVDVDGKPYVPPTTIKGALRALARHDYAETVGDAFGQLLGSRDRKLSTRAGSAAATPPEERPGWVIFSGAYCLEHGKVDQRLDAADGSGMLLAKRTAIDPTFGVPASNKLFQAQMAAPGARFEMRVTILRDPVDFDDPGIVMLVDLLAALQSRGVAVGRGKGDGYGLLKLDKIEKATRIAIVDGQVDAAAPVDVAAWRRMVSAPAKTLVDPASKRYVLTLSSTLPFAVLGPQKAIRTDEKQKGQNNVLRALQRQDGRPELPGASLMGALRARAEWFARRQALRDGLAVEATEDYVFDRIQPLFGADADTIKANRLKRNKMTGFAGILRLHAVTPETAARIEMHSVKVDRFSMGPFDSGLFAVDAFAAPRFRVELYLDRRAEEADRAFVDAFFAWLGADAPCTGLTLGHAGNRGFGWFDVVEERVDA